MRRLPLVVLAVLLLGGPVAEGILAARDNVRIGKYHWGRRDEPFTLEVGDNVSRRWNRYLDRSVKEWNRSGVVRPKVANGSSNPNKCKETKGRIEVCNGFYGGESDNVFWLGITRILYDSQDHITAATVKLNDSYFVSGKYSRSDAKRHTMCHELGHAFGLDHASTSSCMNDSEQAIFDNVKPIRRDFRALEKKYDHRDRQCEVTVGERDRDCGRGSRGASRSGASGEGFFDIETLPNAHTGPSGQHTRTVEELPDGQKVVTFISWVE
jgi:hypothetical protein